MNTKVKKFIAVSLIGITTIGNVPTIAFAESAPITSYAELTNTLVQKYLADMEQYAINRNNIDLEECQRYKNIFDEAYSAGEIFVNADGFLRVKESLKNELEDETYTKLINSLETMNYCLEIGACTFNTQEGVFETVPLNVYLNSNKERSLSNYSVAAVTNLNLGSLVHNNYWEIKSIYQNAMMINPEGGWASAVSIWVNRVREGGVWDYKVQPGYSPYDKEFYCTYGLNNSKQGIRKSEFIGNYNYAYTGSILFSLATLKKGSELIAGGPEKDVLDQPVIEEGYYDSVGEYPKVCVNLQTDVR